MNSSARGVPSIMRRKAVKNQNNRQLTDDENYVADTCRYCVVSASVLVLITLFVFFGVYLNFDGHKYVRFSTKNCGKGVLDVNFADSDECCIGSEDQISFICRSSYDEVGKMLTSLWSWLFALIPLAFTIITENLLFGMNIYNSIKRLISYFLIFLFRLVSYSYNY